MNIQIRPLLITVGIGIIIIVGIEIIGRMILITSGSSLIEEFFPIISLVFNIIIGALYPLFASRKARIPTQTGALGGAISVILATILSSFLTIFYRVFTLQEIISSISTAFSIFLGFYFYIGWLTTGVAGAIGGILAVELMNKQKGLPLDTSTQMAIKWSIAVVGLLTIFLICRGGDIFVALFLAIFRSFWVFSATFFIVFVISKIYRLLPEQYSPPEWVVILIILIVCFGCFFYLNLAGLDWLQKYRID